MTAVPPEELGRICEVTETWHVYKNSLLVGSRLNLWDSLPLILVAARDDDPKRRALGSQLADEWLARSVRIFVGPNPAQLHSVGAALEASRERLPSKLWSELTLPS